PPLPPGVVFLCDLGDAMYSLVDCRTPDGQIWFWSEGDRHPQTYTLLTWLDEWLDGALPEPPEHRWAKDDTGAWLGRPLPLDSFVYE
ncbi:MAG: hypothetical protein SYR96_40340, partial [Actinomycetota bacterium]|nr:hypothetical protein [Actinomycetota bacterium]